MNDKDIVNLVDCPKCGSKIGDPCVSRAGNDKEISHIERCQALGIDIKTKYEKPTYVNNDFEKNILSVPCPHCHALKEVHCSNSKGYDLHVCDSHSARCRDMILSRREIGVKPVCKKINYKVIRENVEGVRFKITEQTHRCEFFGKDGSPSFVASNGVSLTSHISPEWSHSKNNLSVWGCKDWDSFVIEVYRLTFEKIIVAINEYNKFFSGDEIINEQENPEKEKNMKKDIVDVAPKINEANTKDDEDEYFFIWCDKKQGMTKEEASHKIEEIHKKKDGSKYTLVKGKVVTPKITYTITL